MYCSSNHNVHVCIQPLQYLAYIIYTVCCVFYKRHLNLFEVVKAIRQTIVALVSWECAVFHTARCTGILFQSWYKGEDGGRANPNCHVGKSNIYKVEESRCRDGCLRWECDKYALPLLVHYIISYRPQKPSSDILW